MILDTILRGPVACFSNCETLKVPYGLRKPSEQVVDGNRKAFGHDCSWSSF